MSLKSLLPKLIYLPMIFLVGCERDKPTIRSKNTKKRGKVMTFGERMSEECGFSTAFNRNERPVAA